MRAGIYTVGLFLRGHFRRACMVLRLKYEEDKGFLDSGFMVEGNKEDIDRLNEWLERINK